MSQLPTRNVCLLFLVCILAVANGEDIVITGDTLFLTETNVTYQVVVMQRYPFLTQFKYIFDLNLPSPVNEAIFSESSTAWTYPLTNVPSGSYTLQIQVFVYPFGFKGWIIGEKTIPINIKENLDDFLTIDANQSGLPDYAPDYVYLTNKTIEFFPVFQNQSTVLSRNSTKMDYIWTLKGMHLNETKFSGSKFEPNITIPGQYSLDLNITANIPTNNNKVITKQGKIRKNIDVKLPVTNLKIDGNTFIKNQTLLNLSVTCSGSSNFMYCFKFTKTKTNESCFDSSKVITDCSFPITHYFPRNGTEYLNVGVRNDVSDEMHNIKITIYRVGPKPPLMFVIVPLVASIMVIVIIVLGIAYHINQRRRLNATIEVATVENFGVYDEDKPLIEKTFFQRIRDSFRSLNVFHSSYRDS